MYAIRSYYETPRLILRIELVELGGDRLCNLGTVALGADFGGGDRLHHTEELTPLLRDHLGLHQLHGILTGGLARFELLQLV